MKLVGIVGSNADFSTNRKLLQFMQKYFSDQAEIEICEIKELPAFNEPADTTAPKEVQVLSDKIAQAEGVIIATPEYDHAIPAALKSALEWLSYTTRPLLDKAVMIVGCSHGSLGSSRAQRNLRQILDAPEIKARVLPSSEFLLGQSLTAFNERGSLIDKEKTKELAADFTEFKNFVELTNKLLESHPPKEKTKFAWEEV
ncbi:MAG TPA: NADPH-dependent FMN reductase [Tetragenococcus sp.]|nr:NADPH-dependent FMN reductase [Tetragenococcus sp.]